MNNKYLQNICRKITPHIDPNLGISNEFIHELCVILCPNYFRGVFSSHAFKSSASQHTEIGSIGRSNFFSIVVNVSVRPPPANGHFVLIHARPDRLIYLDPFGRPCSDDNLIPFIRNCRKTRSYHENLRVIQSPLSTFCGMYAVLFAMYYDFPTPPFKNIKWIKSDNPFVLLHNDKICIKYLNTLVKHMKMKRIHFHPKMNKLQMCLS